MRREHSLFPIIGLVLSLATSSVALADKTEDLEETDILPAVQNRKFRTNHEFSATIGILPIDPFYKGLALGGGYAWHFSDIWAIEGRGFWMRNFNTSLRDDLEQNFTIPTTRFAEIQWYGELGVLFKPFYGKLSFLNKALVYGEFYFSLHAAVVRMNGGKRTDAQPQGQGPRMGYGGAPGFGLRGYLNEYFSLRFDMQTMIIYSGGELYYPLTLSLSIAVTTRGDL